jgi:hypothetical protein
MKRKTCGAKCSAALRRSKVNFYGVMLPADEVAKILGVAKAAVLLQQRPKRRASQKQAPEGVCYCGAPVEVRKTRCRPCLDRNSEASRRSRISGDKPWRANRRPPRRSALSISMAAPEHMERA